MTVRDSEVTASGAMPSRILHLVDGSRSDGPSACMDHVKDLISDRSDDVLLSVGGLPDGVHGTLPAGARFPFFQSGLLKSLLKRRRWGDAGFDVVHAWGLRSAALVAGLDRRQAVAISIDGFDASDPQAAVAASTMFSGRAACAFGSNRSLERAWALVGGSRRGAGGEEIIEPVLNPDRFQARSEILRQSWGADSKTTVMGIIGSPMEHLNLLDYGSMSPRCCMFHDHFMLLASSRGARRGDLVRWLGCAGLDVELVFDDRIDSIEEVAGSLDMAVAPSAIAVRNHVCDAAPAIAAASAGVPVVLGVGHPAGDYSGRHPLLHHSLMHGEHAATKWLSENMREKVEIEPDAWQERWAGYLQNLDTLYQRAISLSGASRFIAAS